MLRKRSITKIEPFDRAESKGNSLDFGVLYTTTGTATEEIFITAKRATGEEICVTFTIEDAFEIIEANFYAVEMSSTATEIRDGQPTDVPTLIVLGTGFTEDATRDNAHRFLADVITRIHRTKLT